MLNKLLAFSREYDMIAPKDHIICAVSGGKDSMALLFALYLLKDKLGIRLSAAHFNHNLRGEESRRDAAFVQDFCSRYEIPLYQESALVTAGDKGLEAAARDARYAFLRALPGKIATAHTADDNAETLLLHLVRGTGLKGLGGITPVSGNVIRPMLTVTAQDVSDFLREWSLPHIEDSSNESDCFLRNRLRHHVMPLLKAENPALAQSLSATALRLRADEAFLSRSAQAEPFTVENLRRMHSAQRSRLLEAFLREQGVREPEAAHIKMAENLIFSDNPSAKAQFPGGITIARRYDTLEALVNAPAPEAVVLPCPGSVCFGPWRISCAPAEAVVRRADCFTVLPVGPIWVRPRAAGDTLRLSGGSKTLKKLFIDRKIPAAQRPQIPVIADDGGILGAGYIGVNLDRAAAGLPAVQIHIERNI